MGYTIFHAGELEWQPRGENDPRLVAPLSESERAAILGGNAARIYLGQRGRTLPLHPEG